MIDHVYFCDFPNFLAKAPGEKKVNSFSVVAAKNEGRKMLPSSSIMLVVSYFERCLILSAMRLYKVFFVKPPSEIIESGIKSITSKNNLLLLSM